MRHGIWMALLLAASPALAQRAPEIEERSLEQLQAMQATGAASSESLVAAYLARIARIDRDGPRLRAVIALNPQAIAQARVLDAERRKSRVRGPLHGIPVLIKDNIDTVENATTAGSLALKDNFTRRDAPLVAKLRAAGAVILGKTNLSEWANIRDDDSMSGWSAVGGLVKNPYALDRTACGSSSGSGAAVAASLAAVAVGTETDGSVICPSSINGLVGLKPTVGAVSRTHVVPISHSQDTAGPMARSVKDAAALFAGMIGSDSADAATAEADARRAALIPDWTRASLKGVRLAVLRPQMRAVLAARFDVQLAVLRAAGAVLVEVERPRTEGLGDAEFQVLLMELKTDLAAYLATTPPAVKVRTLADAIAFNRANAATELRYFEQRTFEAAEKTGGTADPAYAAARAKSHKLASEAIDAMLAKAGAEALVTVSNGMAWLSDPVYGDQFQGPSASHLPAVSGYPHLTVPMGLVKGLPVGLSFIGTKWRDGRLLELGFAYEQEAKARVAPAYGTSVDVGAGVAGQVRR